MHKNYNWLYKKYIVEKLSQKTIAKICQVNQSTIHYFLVKFNIPRRKFCGLPKEKCARWNGGKCKTTQGYIHIYQPNHPRVNSRKYVPEQIIVVEKHLNCFLTSKESVHHINEKKDDNRMKNLYLFSSEREHQRYHRNYTLGKIKPIIESNLL